MDSYKNLNRRNFMKAFGLAAAAPGALLRAEGALGAKPRKKIYHEGGIVNKLPSQMIGEYVCELNFSKFIYHPLEKFYAVPLTEKKFLEYWRIRVNEKEPSLRIDSQNGDENLRFIFYHKDDVLFSPVPMPSRAIEFESYKPLVRGDLVEVLNPTAFSKPSEIYVIVSTSFYGRHTMEINYGPVDHRHEINFGQQKIYEGRPESSGACDFTCSGEFDLTQ